MRGSLDATSFAASIPQGMGHVPGVAQQPEGALTCWAVRVSRCACPDRDCRKTHVGGNLPRSKSKTVFITSYLVIFQMLLASCAWKSGKWYHWC